MLGDIVSVRAFCRYKDVPYNRNTQKQTIGWRAEKEAMERKKNGKNDRKSHWKGSRTRSQANSRPKINSKRIST